jgi:hypothetical protein
MAKKSSVLLVGFGLFGLLMAGCGLLQPASSGGGQGYFPHADGYSWRRTSADGATGVSTFEGTTQIGSTTTQVFKETWISISGEVTTLETYIRIDDSGVYFYSPSYPDVSITYLSFPLEIGKSWQYAPISTAGVATVISKETVTVPAGSFECYEIKSVYPSGDIFYYWYGNNAGLVKSSSNSSTGEGVLEWKSF